VSEHIVPTCKGMIFVNVRRYLDKSNQNEHRT
jgi:hypothetical protein